MSTIVSIDHWSKLNKGAGEYPASSTSASEAANEKMVHLRGPVFILSSNFVLSFGGPLAVLVFLIVLSAAGEDHLKTVWRVCFGIGILLPITVFYFRMRMLSPKLYRKGAIKRMSMLLSIGFGFG